MAVTVKLSPSSTGKVSADARVRALPVTNATTSANNIFTDHLYAPRVITRASDNQMVWRWDNADPFGVGQPDTNPAGLTTTFTYNPRFSGQVYDNETGLHYNYHRTYSPAIGGYTQPDPIGLNGGQLSLYGYVGGNPVNWVDPLGLAHGDPYDTEQGAVKDAAKDINAKGPQRIEWGGWICERDDGFFTYTKPRTDNEETHVSPGSQCECPGRTVADYHSHWPKKGYKRWRNISDDDKWSNFFNSKAGYVIRPDGTIGVYVPPPPWEVPSRFTYDTGYTGEVR